MSTHWRPNLMRTGRALTALLGALAAAGCGSSRPTIQLPLEPIPYADTLPSTAPKERQINEVARLLDISVSGEIGHALSLRRLVGAGHEALNVTHFDDVVNSAWFEHRIDLGDMTPDDVARGPTTIGPDTSRTLTVIAGKAAGISPGFTVRDARGNTFLFKFDPKGNLHLASAAGVISNRLFHAAGYYTPEDFIVVFDPARLVLDPEAEITEPTGAERAMTESDIAAVLSLTDPLPDGRFHALASKFVPGRPLDPFYFSGVRKDDANDYYHHQYRRELRGLYVVSSWLNHVDMRYANTLDVFIDPPGYVRHYLIDFAATLGSGTIRPHNPREGSEYNFAFWPTMARTFTLGFYQKGWEGVEYQQIHPSIGWIPTESFDPGGWRPNWPNDAFRSVTPADGYWGAKLVAGFSDQHIRAVVEEGALPVAEARHSLADILIARRDKIIEYWYAAVTPIERVDARLSSSGAPSLELSFDDLGLAAEVWTAEATRYTWQFEDVYHRVNAAGEDTAAPGERQTLRIPLDGAMLSLEAVSEAEATARLKINVQRDGEFPGRAAEVLLRWLGAEAGYRVVGLRH
jgi:hypothetical protein